MPVKRKVCCFRLFPNAPDFDLRVDARRRRAEIPEAYAVFEHGAEIPRGHLTARLTGAKLESVPRYFAARQREGGQPLCGSGFSNSLEGASADEIMIPRDRRLKTCLERVGCRIEVLTGQ